MRAIHISDSIRFRGVARAVSIALVAIMSWSSIAAAQDGALTAGSRIRIQSAMRTHSLSTVQAVFRTHVAPPIARRTDPRLLSRIGTTRVRAWMMSPARHPTTNGGIAGATLPPAIEIAVAPLITITSPPAASGVR